MNNKKKKKQKYANKGREVCTYDLKRETDSKKHFLDASDLHKIRLKWLHVPDPFTP